MKKIIIFLMIIIQLAFDDCQEKKEEREFFCHIKPTKEHYEVMSYFLQSYLPKEKLVYIENISDDMNWIFEDGVEEILDEFLNFLGEEDRNFIKAEIKTFRNRRCYLEKKFCLSYRYKLVSPNFKPKKKKTRIQFDQGEAIINVYEHPLLIFSIPIYNKKKDIAFLSFTYFRGPSRMYGGWAIMEKEFDYWRIVRVQIVIIS